MISATFYKGGDEVPVGYKNGEELILKFARLSDKDMGRLRRAGDALPHAVHANPALAEAKKRKVSLAGSGKVKPIDPIYPPEKKQA